MGHFYINSSTHEIQMIKKLHNNNHLSTKQRNNSETKKNVDISIF